MIRQRMSLFCMDVTETYHAYCLYWHRIWLGCSMNVVLRITHAAVIALLFAMGVGDCYAQTPIGGIVNKYVSVTSIVPCDSMVTVGNPISLRPGDRVLLIQMKGAGISTNNDPAFGTIMSIDGAGACEFLTIKRVDGERVSFTTGMVHTYDASGAVQLITVPTYTSARVTSQLTAQPWNGTVGGVVAIEVSESLYLNADISTSGLGFIGGRLSVPKSRCDISDYLLNWEFGLAGEKGEGIASLRVNYPLAGRGPLANGGGGGNGNNAGGGGGSNGGSGGKGGDANVYCRTNMSVGGLPGVVLGNYISQQRLYLGGGGGGSHQNDLQGTNGSNGGGIVIIKAGILHGNGRTISANGLSVVLDADMDAAGGGGAGGTVLLDVGVVTSPLSIHARGGNGGNVKHLYNGHGPGGGGGGGIVVTTQPLTNITIDVRGGTAGTHTNTSNEAYNQSRGAENGSQGVVITGFTWRVPVSYQLSAWGGGPICENVTTARLEATPGFATYVWSDGQTGQAINVSKAGTYSVIATDSSGCPRSAGGVNVWYNPTQFTMEDKLDFAAVPFEATKWMSMTFTNTDDEDIVIERFENAQNFRVISPSTTPVVVRAGTSALVVVEFYAIEDRTYDETITAFISAPCPDTHTVSLHALVSPIWSTFSIPDTTAAVGDTSFALPLNVYVLPDTTVLTATHLKIDVSMDARLFAPTTVTRGTIVGNVIDVLNNTRTLTIEIDSIDLYGLNNTVTYIKGAVLMSSVLESPIYSSNVEWIEVWQQPITDHDDGSLEVDPVCFQGGRAIKLYDMPTMSISPNPASDVVNIETRLSAPGTYGVEVSDLLGNTVHTESLEFSGTASEEHTISLDATAWSAGTYVVVYRTPLVAFSQRIVIAR